MKRASLIILAVLFIDQSLKIWIKTHMFMGEEIDFANWFQIHFTENNGMAFGLEIGGGFGKIFLSVFRIAASIGIGWYLLHLIRHNAHPVMITCFSLIFAGAIGNILDSAFYGLLFSDSYEGVAKFLPAGGGYAGFLHGRVVDMLYFPLFSGQFPSWFPFWKNEPFLFFRPIFNIADSSISIGVFLLLVFQKKFSHYVDENSSETISSSEVQ